MSMLKGLKWFDASEIAITYCLIAALNLLTGLDYLLGEMMKY